MGGQSSVAVSCGVGHRCGSEPVLLWWWCRLADVALIQPLAWEILDATSVALKSEKKKKRKIEEEVFLSTFKFFLSLISKICFQT